MISDLSLSKIFSGLLNLANDNAKETNISTLENRSFAIAIDELPQDIGIHVENGKVHPLAADEIPNADVMVSGNIKAILNMIQNHDGLDNDELYITGKISTAKYFQQFLSELAIDWQYLFGKFMSPENAKKSTEAFLQGIHFAKASKDQALEDIKKYLIEEKQVFVPQSEFTQLKSDIQHFNQRLDTLLKNIDKYTGE